MKKINVKFFSQESFRGNLSIYSIDIRKNRYIYESRASLISNLFEIEKKYDVEFCESYENVCVFYSNLEALNNNDKNLINIQNKLELGKTKRVIFFQLDMNWSIADNAVEQIENKLTNYFGVHISKVILTITGLSSKHKWNKIQPKYNLGFFTYVFNKNINEGKKYDLQITNRNKWFYTTQNRIRPARLYLYDYLIENNLLEQFEYSFFSITENINKEYVSWNDIIGSDEELKTDRDFYPIKRFDNENLQCGHKDTQVVNFEKSLNTYIDLIFETTYNVLNVFPFSEKSFKGILSKKPFILFGGPNIYKGMEQLGFKNYDELIDTNEYSKHHNTKDRLKIVLESVKKICILDIADVRKYYIEQKEKIEHNYNRLIELINDNDNEFLDLFK
jgi:hypothetical protein